MKIKLLKTILELTFSGILCSCATNTGTPQKSSATPSNTGCEYDVAASVWPAYQNTPDWKRYGHFPKNIGEWEFVKEAASKKPHHKQPKVPLWGYELENQPIVWARKVDACLASGINVLIFDWYWYDGKPYLEDSLNAFLKAPNNERMKFALMWANHSIDDLWDKTVPVKCTDKNGYRNIRATPKVSFEEFKNVLVPRWIAYFKSPNYYKINGKPLFQVFTPVYLKEFFGGVDKVAEAFAYFNQKAVEAGFAGVEIQCIESQLKRKDCAEEFKREGYSGAFAYNWLELVPFSGSYYLDYTNRPDMDYKEWGEAAFAELDRRAAANPHFQHYPNVSCGWDTNPRFPDNYYTPIALNNTPERFEYFLRKAKAWADKNIREGKPKLILINSLNEWTEGSYLEPDEEHGYGFLNAVARVFGGRGQAKE